ncbi:MAG: ammonia-forming cytochrome c nitrite reductase subunit c552 [Deltaproteobacteria bacterium]|nr:ammonia-forming cytochrome c nitrite reductase subunit c552 [Deltaproteobacteria bacterium]
MSFSVHPSVVRVLMVFAILAVLAGCQPSKPEPRQTVVIPDGEIDPSVWGKAYPEEYELWKKTAEPISKRTSKYKTGMDGGLITVDKLSEFPYMALLFNGWGFGTEYNEPRGHANMIRDQLEIDSSRLKAGGVCLTCKTPYAPKLQKELGPDYYKKPFKEILDKIPEKDRTLGVACIDCHSNKDMTLKISRGFTLTKALQDMGTNPDALTRQEMRTTVCAQCHVTYAINKDAEGKSTGVYFPWQNSKWGAVTIEDIIKRLRSDETVKEWKQTVTGFKMAFIRHPEFEFWTNNSVHFKAGASCADCHMPYTKVGVYKISDHRVMSPVQNEMRACHQCHAESPDWLKERVFSIQDRTVSMMLRSGYATATVAKLFEATHKARDAGKTIDEELYNKAKDFYEEAFYRTLFMGAENSIGFHNPPEGLRILGDAIAFATKSEGFLRQLLAKAGVDVPIKVDLEIMKYVDERGEKKLKFNPSLEFKDPMGLQDRF